MDTANQPAVSGNGGALLAGGPLTMSSREIAELTGSSHDNVLKTVRALVDRGVVSGNETPYTHPQNGQTYAEFLLSFGDTMVVVSGYSVELRARIIDRWQALELRAAGGLDIAEPVRIATEAMKLAPLAVRAARAFGLDKNAAAISASQYVRRLTGVDLLGAFGSTHLPAERQDAQWFTPTELGARIDISARKFNLLLAEAGLQARQGEDWVPTAAAESLYRLFDTGKRHGSGVFVQQMKWSPHVLPLLKSEKQVSKITDRDGPIPVIDQAS
jgi:hypothetical protein